MAVIATTPGQIDPNPQNLEAHRRNWQKLAIMLVGPGVSLDDGGGINAACRLTVITPTRLLVNGANSVTLTGYQYTVTLTDHTQPANKGWFGPVSGADAVPTFRQMLSVDVSTTSLAAGKYLTTDGTNNSWATVTVPVTAAALPLYLNGSTVTMSATSSMAFGAIVCAGSASFAGAVSITGATSTVTLSGPLIGNSTQNSSLAGSLTIAKDLTINGTGNLNMAGIILNGNVGAGTSYREMSIRADGYNIFRGLTLFGVFSDSINGTFFQVGNGSASDATVFTSQGGVIFARLGFSATGTTIYDGGYSRMPAPIATLHIQGSTEGSKTRTILIRNATTQTMLEMQNAGSVVLLSVDANGNLAANSTGSHSISGSLTITKSLTANGTANSFETMGIKSGANKSCGTATLVAGSVTVSNTRVTANSMIHLTVHVVGGTVGVPTRGTVVANTSFDINSTSILDTSQVAWLIVEPT